MKVLNFFFMIITGMLLFLFTGCDKKTVSIESLLNEMVDRNELARFPNPAFVCKQFSSYDRASIAKDQPGWFANNDCSMFVRVEKVNGRTEYVMMDTEGPGAIVRFWMTFGGRNSGRGTMRIYIDDYSTPAIEGAAMDILSGDLICSYPLAASVSELTAYDRRGHNLYFPVPYAQRCKVTYENDDLNENDPGSSRIYIYYNINYRTYEQGVKVLSWSTAEMEKNQSLIANVQKRLADKERDVVENSRLALNATLQPGERKSFTISGANAIQQLSMALNATDKEQALRSTVLEIAFDGERTVWSPVGEFYGIGYKSLYTSTWYTQTEKDGLMSSFWVMPFKKECVITLYNLGEQVVTVSNAFAVCNTWKWDKRSMYFGAGWQQYTSQPAGSEDAMNDLNFVTLQGKGVYVGDALSIFNTTRYWWGEGDEKIYVDGESFPSHFGTGSEDYYGYAWCRPEVFTDHPYIAQPQGIGNENIDLTVNTRYRGLDGIPFNKTIQVDMELAPWRKSQFNFAPVAIWYAQPGVSINPLPCPDVARLPVAQTRNDVIKPVYYEKGIIEGEDMYEISTGGSVSPQTTNNAGLSGNTRVRWTNGAVGNELTLSFFMKESGRFNIKAALSVSSDSGIFALSMNDKQALSNFDAYSPTMDIKVVNLGTFDLNAGENFLKVKIINRNPNSTRYAFGLDYIELSM